jgi:hypothetical protein
MSGGSYEYLCFKDGEDLFGDQVDRNMQAMADRLAGLGYAQDAAQETQWLLLEIRASANRIQTAKNRLEKIWRAVEWWDSCDSSEDGVKNALAAYRGEKGDNP